MKTTAPAAFRRAAPSRVPVVAPSAFPASTLNYTWLGSAPPAWSTGSNWSGGSAPAANSSVSQAIRYTATPATATASQVNNPYFIDSLTFTANAPAYTVTSSGTGSLNVLYGIANDGTSAQTVNVPLTGRTSTLSISSSVSGGSLTLGGAINAAANSAITVDGPGNVAIGGAISGSAVSLTKTGMGTLTLSGTNTYSGGISVSAGTLAVTAGTVGVAGSTAQLLIDGTGTGASAATVNLSGTASLSTGRAFIGYNGTGVFNQTGGTFTTNGDILAYGFNSPNFNGNGTYSLGGGTLTIGSIVVGGTGNNVFHFNGGTLLPAASSTTFIQGLTTLDVQAGGARIDTAGFDITILDQIKHDTTSGAPATDGGLTKVGAGTLTLKGFNSYAGTTTVSVGTLVVPANASIGVVGGSGNFVVDGTGTGAAAILGGNFNLGNVSVGVNNTGVVTQTAGTVNTYYLFSLVDGVTLGTNANSSGTYNFNGGTLQAQVSTTAFMQGLTTADVQAGGAKIDTDFNRVTIAQKLVHDTTPGAPATDGGLAKNNQGILTLTGANTYTGQTSINGGTLLANNLTGSATGSGLVEVYSGGTLGGTGTIAGNVSAENGSFVNAGISGPGRLTINSHLVLAGGSTLLVEIGGTTAGSGYDQIVLGVAAALNGGNLSVSLVNGFTLSIGQKFFIIDTAGTPSAPGTFGNASGNMYTDAAGNQYLVNYLDRDPAQGDLLFNDISLTVVPEPGAWTLLLVAAGGLAGTWVWRRLRAA